MITEFDRLYHSLLLHSLIKSGRHKEVCASELSGEDPYESTRYCRIYALLELDRWDQAYTELLPFLNNDTSEGIKILVSNLQLNLGIKNLETGLLNQGFQLIKEAFALEQENADNKNLRGCYKSNPYSNLYLNERKQVQAQWEDERLKNIEALTLTHHLAIFYYEWAIRQEDCILKLVTHAAENGLSCGDINKWDELIGGLSEKSLPEPCFRGNIRQYKCTKCDWEIICHGEIIDPDELWINAISNWVAVLYTEKFWKKFIEKRRCAAGINFSEDSVESAKERVLREFMDLLNKYLDKYGELDSVVHSQRFSHYTDLLNWERYTAKLLGKELADVRTKAIPEGFVCGSLLLKKLGIKENVINLVGKLGECRDEEIISELNLLLSEYGLAYSCIRNGNYRVAMSHLEALSEKSKKSGLWKKLSGDALLAWGIRELRVDFNKAEELLLKVVADGMTEQAKKAREALLSNYIRKSRRLIKAKPDEAVNLLSRIDEAFHVPEILELLAAAHLQCGELTLSKKQFKRSVAHLKKAIGVDPDFLPALKALALALNNWGVSLSNEGITELAIPKYKEALAYDEDSALVRSNLAFALFALTRADMDHGKYDRVIAMVEEALQYAQRDEKVRQSAASILNAVGVKFANQSRKSKAIDCFRRALELDPSNFTIHSNLSSVSTLGAMAVNKISRMMKGEK